MSCLLAVLAHPDDESLACGGLLARCADAGARVCLLCVTRGEDAPTPDGDRLALAATRKRELDEAARVLGIGEVTLLEYPDGELQWLDADRAERLTTDIGNVLGRVAPDVVVTFGADGLYWHPDHITLHHATTAAVEALGDSAPALYYVTLPPGAVRAIVDTVVRQSPDGAEHRHVFGIDDPDAFGALAAPPTLVVDVSRVAVRKLRALKCHRSQLAGGAFERVRESDAARLLGIEHFHRAAVGSGAPAFIERFAAS